eukprot:CAMPEP_0197621182 /NCGR_PEP_ID=MMETSP1338-20131121/1797_1 /TAXON_ID=43686 ORGANISM="Pelagodinium beii, Strain RCC1491" /NCGR_SAMPLE_ID=MMETSP1338 /ASSEMBLY_ACC=CAM_ASM_000754 /LENGTH=247 /DNA_ID=CAMNT_0043190543 /DNA_START=36 /DNA_END=779 /DNA_ORIENTATION=-
MVVGQGGHDSNRNGNEVTLVANAPPLDYSFKELRTCGEIETEEPRSGAKHPSPEAKEGDENHGADAGAGGLAMSNSTGNMANKVNPLEPKLRMVLRKVTTSVKLNNNMLESAVGLPQALETAMPNPLLNLQWLDISFNQLVTIEADLLRFLNLKALYLHGNCISRLSSVERLRKLPKLLSLTLNGNPIESSKIYRCYVIGALPALKSLDHSTITDDEVKNAAAWFVGHEARAKKRKEEMAENAMIDG